MAREKYFDKKRCKPNGISLLEVTLALAVSSIGVFSALNYWETHSQRTVVNFAKELKHFIDQLAEAAHASHTTFELRVEQASDGKRVSATPTSEQPNVKGATLPIPRRVSVTGRFANPNAPEVALLYPASATPGSFSVIDTFGTSCSIVQTLHSGRRFICNSPR